MAQIHDRNERFAKIRVWLGGPLPQAPSPHQQVTQMFKDEQDLNLRLSNSHQPWALMNQTFNSAIGTTEYTLRNRTFGESFAPPPNILPGETGKVYFVTRTTNNPDLPYISVPFDDYNSLNYGKMPPAANSTLRVPERIAFYRSGFEDAALIAVLQPTPVEVLNYTIYQFIGSLDRYSAQMDASALVTELVDYLDLRTSIALLPYTEWALGDRDFNLARRKEISAGLLWQLGDVARPGDLAHTVEEYIRQINAPKSFDIGYWDDED